MTNVKKKSFRLYNDWKESIQILSREQKGELFEAIIKYHTEEEGESTFDDPLVNAIFIPMRQQFERDGIAYLKRVKDGEKGGKVAHMGSPEAKRIYKEYTENATGNKHNRAFAIPNIEALLEVYDYSDIELGMNYYFRKKETDSIKTPRTAEGFFGNVFNDPDQHVITEFIDLARSVEDL